MGLFRKNGTACGQASSGNSLCIRGMTLKGISARNGPSWQNCLKWRKRFIEKRLDGLNDVARSDKSAEIAPEEQFDVIARACTDPGDGSTKWSIRKLADGCGFPKFTFHRILSEASLKLHKSVYWYGKSPNPEFSEKQAAIIGLYLSPPENALVIGVAEKSQIQAVERTQSMLPLRPGKAGRADPCLDKIRDQVPACGPNGP